MNQINSSLSFYPLHQLARAPGSDICAELLNHGTNHFSIGGDYALFTLVGSPYLQGGRGPIRLI
jgi:hypothetical protein